LLEGVKPRREPAGCRMARNPESNENPFTGQKKTRPEKLILLWLFLSPNPQPLLPC